jgi:ribonucleoside-diphosphate reductase beta chain
MESILTENKNRYIIYPIKYHNLWELYKKGIANFWTAEEIVFNNDITDFHMKLNDNERHFIKYILAFFAGSDGIVNENLCLRFYKDIQIPEARMFYTNQMMMESIHAETYSLMIDTFIKDTEEKTFLFNAIQNIPCITKKAEWAIKWIESADEFSKRLVAFACVEGIFFSGAFCSIFWLKKRGLMSGLCFSNELISRDEGLHTEFACSLYQLLDNKLPEDTIHTIIKEAVELEKEFIVDSLPCRLIGMNSDLMTKYIEFVADRLSLQLGYNKIYKTENPFDFMENISLDSKTNFFEKKNSNYQKAGVFGGDKTFELISDF